MARRRWSRGRGVLTSALIALCAGAGAGACDSVLGIEEPKPKPPPGGEAGAGGEGANALGSGGSEVMSGAGGEPATTRECEPEAVRCAGEADNSPEICDATGRWMPNDAAADGEDGACAVLCSQGECRQCVDDAVRCSVCDEGDPDCNQRQPQTCVDGAWEDVGARCAHYCDAGSCKTPTSCNASAGSRARCVDGESCCTSLLVPGGTFKRSYDGTERFNDPGFPAEISAFYLDKFEVTVGRMKQFVAVYPQLDLKEGDGKAAHIADDNGWSTHYDLPPDTDALLAQLQCEGTTWSDAELNIQLPANCVPFNLAYAFCIWDGGRLPTEAEWNFAAAGGDQQRVYPWVAPASGPPITDDYANYGNAHPGPIEVGSKALGHGRWGHADLAGNVGEWTLDYFADYSSELCRDCVNATTSLDRSVKGGAYSLTNVYLPVSLRAPIGADQRQPELGIRCARDFE